MDVKHLKFHILQKFKHVFIILLWKMLLKVSNSMYDLILLKLKTKYFQVKFLSACCLIQIGIRKLMVTWTQLATTA